MKLQELAQRVGGVVHGDPEIEILGVGTIQDGQEGQISFLANAKYRSFLKTTKASAVILTERDLEFCPCSAIFVQNPYYAYAQIAACFAKKPCYQPGIHPTAIIGERCSIAETASIGANVVVEDDVVIGERTRIDPGCVIGERTTIGKDAHFWANVTVYYGVTIGDRVELHSGVVIGADGFGWAQYEKGWYPVPQLGGVVIKDDVSIGANTTVDRGALDDTVIGLGSKLDNQVQIGHNVRLGEHCVMAGCSGIAGSTTVGNYCMIGGRASINGHITLTDKVMLTGVAMITKSITEPGVYSSGTGFMSTQLWHKNVARFKQLDQMARRITLLEKERDVKKEEK